MLKTIGVIILFLGSNPRFPTNLEAWQSLVYCNGLCQTKKNNRNKIFYKICKMSDKSLRTQKGNDTKYENFINRWKQGLETGMRGTTAISRHIRRYLFEKFENSCSICEWSEINPYTGLIPLEVEHVDGNYTNNKEDNLVLLCPNCHSLTSTYKALNKGKGRPR